MSYFAAKVTSGICGLFNYPFPKHRGYFRGTENPEFSWAVPCTATHPATPLELLGAYAGAGTSTNQRTQFILFFTLPPLFPCPLQGARGRRVPQQLACRVPPSPATVGPASRQPLPVWSPALARPLLSSWRCSRSWLAAARPSWNAHVPRKGFLNFLTLRSPGRAQLSVHLP